MGKKEEKQEKLEKKLIEKEQKAEEIKNKDLRVKAFKEEIDKLIKEKINEQTKNGINIKEYKEQIDKYAKERVEAETSSQTVKTLKKQLSSKKCASGIKSFIILCLLACIGYGVYYLYKDGYFDEKKNGTKCECKTDNTSSKDDSNTKTDDKKDDVKKDENSLEVLQEKYGSLLDNITFDFNGGFVFLQNKF